MTEFGENGTVLSVSTLDQPSMAAPARIRRVKLAVFLCGIVACFSVALIGGLGLFVLNTIGHAFSLGGVDAFMNGGLGRFAYGMAVAMIGSALNWVMFYATIPAAWIALSASIGRFPRRGLVASAPYRHWGAIWGAVLVAMVTAPAAAAIDWQEVSVTGKLGAFAGGLVGGAGIGALAGLVCASLFLLIVRPASQIETIDEDVFS